MGIIFSPFLYVLSFVRALLIVIVMIVFMLSYSFSLLFSKNTKKRAFRLRRNYLRLANVILNVRSKIEGSPISEPALYICNHRSFADPIILLKHLDAFVIAKAEVASYPVINKGAELTGIVYVKRENKDSRQATRDMMIDILKSGHNVLIYPEGTVGKEKETLEFKKGAFIACAKEGFPVVPVALEYQSPRDLWVIHNFVKQYLYQFAKWSTPVKLAFGPVIREADGIDMHDRAHSWVNGKIVEMQKGWSKTFS